MRVFITGASGFIGSHLVEKLLNRNWQVRVLFHNRSIHREKECEIVKGDIRDLSLLEKSLDGTDVLFHLAASLGASLINKKEFYQINTEGTENILRAAQKAGVKRIIHFSSAGVLGSVKKNELADEEYPLNPRSIYDKTKLEGERTALNFARNGMDIVIVRPGWTYGPGDRRTFKLIKAIAKKRFILVTKGEAWQTPVHINDLIDGVLLCSERGKKGEIYHIAGNEIITVKKIAEIIALSSGNKIPPFSLPLFPVKAAVWPVEKISYLFKREAPLSMGKLSFFIHPKPLAIQKAIQDLGFSPKVDFNTGMAQTVAWYIRNEWI